ncbi:MAG: ABC transporter ATP-binding protein [Candidatus Zhuqueibacterota bacterium]
MITTSLSDWNIFVYFLRYLRPVWRLMLLVLVLAIIITTLDINTVILPLLIRKFIDQVLGQQDWHVFRILVIVILVQIVLYFSFSLIYELVKYVVSMRLGMTLGMNVFRHVMKLPLSFFQQRPIGEHMYRIGSNFDPGFANLAILGMLFELTGTAKSAQQPMVGKDVDGVLGMLTQSLDLLIRVLFRLGLILFTITIGFSAQVGIALIIFCIPYIWVIHRFYNVQRNIDFKFRGKSQNFLAGLQEWFAGIKTIKAFGKGRHETRKNIRLYVTMLRVEWQNYFMKLVTDDFIFLFRYLFIVAALFYVAVQQNQTAGAIFGLYLLLDQFFSPINLMIRVFEGIRLQLIPSRRLMDTLNVEPSIRERENAVALDSFSGSYAIDRVSFGYVPEKEVLSDITIHTAPGKKVAIVGPSGSGKTSLVNLILRFYDPASGEIQADRVDLRDLKSATYYRHIGIILQEDFLFSGTVCDNIRYGKPDATEAEIVDAAKLAAVHDDILSLPRGYDTDLAEGSKLSGGQRQRIAIARALIRKPSVLVLDEATSALDSQTAATIEATLNRVCAGKTVIIITHRLNSVRDCDEIFVLNKGRVIEQGSFRQLLNQKGLFASLYQKQVQV